MLLPLRASALAFLVVALASPLSAQEAPRKPRGDTWEPDDYEEKCLARASERALKAAETEGHRWQRELIKAYPNATIGASLTEDDVAKWFDVLAGEHKDWRRDAAPNKAIADLFDRAIQRMELGPVPSIRREEFLPLAKRNLAHRADRQPKPEERLAEADRVFRVLDRDGNGSLETGEWTERLRTHIKKADADGNRRIDMDEYRKFFEERVAESTEASAKAAAAAKPDPAAVRAGKLPAWFSQLDTDGDGQIGLYEWRRANRPVEEFTAMDLDGDGLLPPDEYLRYVKQVEAESRANGAAKNPPGPLPERHAGRDMKK